MVPQATMPIWGLISFGWKRQMLEGIRSGENGDEDEYLFCTNLFLGEDGASQKTVQSLRTCHFVSFSCHGVPGPRSQAWFIYIFLISFWKLDHGQPSATLPASDLRPRPVVVFKSTTRLSCYAKPPIMMTKLQFAVALYVNSKLQVLTMSFFVTIYHNLKYYLLPPFLFLSWLLNSRSCKLYL